MVGNFVVPFVQSKLQVKVEGRRMKKGRVKELKGGPEFITTKLATQAARKGVRALPRRGNRWSGVNFFLYGGFQFFRGFGGDLGGAVLQE